jgi:hypothetical protein
MTIFKHIFRSGNDCVVRVPDVVSDPGLQHISVQWERFPPSVADQLEWEHEVLPCLAEKMGAHQ